MAITYHSSRRIQGGVENVTTSTNGTTADATNSSSGTSQVTGKVGNALDFSSGRYTIPKEATDFGTEWSFNFWVNPQSASGNDYYLHHTSSSHVGSSFYMYNSDDDPSGSGGVMVNVRDSTNTRLTLDASNNHIIFDINSLAGTWVMCTVTWNNSDKKIRLYQNGTLHATSKAWTHTSAGNMAVSGADWTIGNYQTQTASTYSARSKFDEWSFWSTTLSQADITELYTGIEATELSNSTAISKLKIYYNFEQGANNTITNQAPTTVSVRDAKPTNVQVGSRFEETDTRKMYDKESNEYKIHTFTATGNSTFAVTGSGDVEYLVVAGGGGGYCGGGGAGGMRTGTLSVSAGNKTVTVGAGGYSGQCNVNGHGDNGVGGNSVFDSITSTGGGFGGGAGGANNTEGGSSGGAGGNYTSNGGYPEDSVTPNQGNNGGKSDLSVSQKSGGGGGAGQVGGNASDGMLGGNGLASTISGSSVIYAGGGGGSFSSNNGGTSGAGGTGGGGGVGSAGTANTGGGGSGMNNSARAGYGGSGIVIVRYLTSSGITATGGTITTYNGWREIGT